MVPKIVKKIVSTHIFVNQRLHTAMLEHLLGAGADGVEIFCARQHFNYTDRGEIEALAGWFKQNPMALHSMHSPMYCDDCWGRSGEPSVNIAAADKRRRILAVDEVQRALEFADRVPFRYLIQHIGEGDEEFSEQKQDAAFSSLERLRVVARQVGVTVLVENIPNGLSTPTRLMEFLRRTHLDNIGVCFDVGHANLRAELFGGGGAMVAWNVVKDRVRSTHLHDNHGERDEHLWPSEGTIPWGEFMPALASQPGEIPWVIEIRDQPQGSAAFDGIRRAFERLEQAATAAPHSS
jgi:sugar phosphate isomerase/epimerase